MRQNMTGSHNTCSDEYLWTINDVVFSDKDRARFRSKFERRGDHECWLWEAATDRAGYGQFRVGKRCQYAHRVAWVMANGPIPDGKEICHRCDQRNCVNDAHLFLGTHQENMADAKVKGRMRPFPRPETRKVSDAVIAEMRALRAAGELQQLIADRFGVTQTFVSMVVNGKRRTA